MKIISTKKAPAAIGPYSQAIRVDNFLFCSGQIGIDPKTNQLVEGLENQVKQALDNLKAVITSAGFNLKDVVKTTLYLKNIADFSCVNEIYGNFFGNHKPARSTIEASHLPKGALFEIEAIVYKKA